MKIISLILLLLGSTYLSADQTSKWLNSLVKPRYKVYELKSENLKANFEKYDFSDIFTPKTKVLGFIDPNFRRLKMNFEKVEKLSNDEYSVVGYSEVRGNRCGFEGIISIQQVREYKQFQYGIDDEYKSKGIKSQGIVIGEYKFKENPKQKYSGLFSGLMTGYWYINSEGNLKLDNIEYFSDNYKHNQYVGTWQMYGSNKTKVANWGEFRIPFSSGLDIGAAEFDAHPDYYESGWEDHKR